MNEPFPAAVRDARDRAAQSPVHDERTAALLGIALGVAFTVCFLTGLYSHLLQHPVSWLAVPSRPVGLYRVTQGLHVISGIAAIPLLLAKLWSVYPKLFAWPPVSGPAQAIERVLLFPLVCGTVLQLFTGSANIARWYPWRFFFPTAHYWVSWIVMGALAAHLGAKVTTTRRAVRRGAAGAEGVHVVDAAPPEPGALGRRGFLAATAAASALLTVTTAGQTVPLLRRFTLFAPRRPDVGSQGVPVNRAAAEAGVVAAASDPAYRLVVDGNVPTPRSFDLAELQALRRRAATLPIACVEGWSVSARWSGIAVRDLLQMAGLAEGVHPEVEVHSLERGGLYATSTLSPAHVGEGDTLLALELNGAPLDLDHGFPLRLIAPNRPGVLQTKWVTRLVVR